MSEITNIKEQVTRKRSKLKQLFNDLYVPTYVSHLIMICSLIMIYLILNKSGVFLQLETGKKEGLESFFRIALAIGIIFVYISAKLANAHLFLSFFNKTLIFSVGIWFFYFSGINVNEVFSYPIPLYGVVILVAVVLLLGKLLGRKKINKS